MEKLSSFCVRVTAPKALNEFTSVSCGHRKIEKVSASWPRLDSIVRQVKSGLRSFFSFGATHIKVERISRTCEVDRCRYMLMKELSGSNSQERVCEKWARFRSASEDLKALYDDKRFPKPPTSIETDPRMCRMTEHGVKQARYSFACEFPGLDEQPTKAFGKLNSLLKMMSSGHNQRLSEYGASLREYRSSDLPLAVIAMRSDLIDSYARQIEKLDADIRSGVRIIGREEVDVLRCSVILLRKLGKQQNGHQTFEFQKKVEGLANRLAQYCVNHLVEKLVVAKDMGSNGKLVGKRIFESIAALILPKEGMINVQGVFIQNQACSKAFYKMTVREIESTQMFLKKLNLVSDSCLLRTELINALVKHGDHAYANLHEEDSKLTGWENDDRKSFNPDDAVPVTTENSQENKRCKVQVGKEIRNQVAKKDAGHQMQDFYTAWNFNFSA